MFLEETNGFVIVGVIPCVNGHPPELDKVRLPVLLVDFIVKEHVSAMIAELSGSSFIVIELLPSKSIVRFSCSIDIFCSISAPLNESVLVCGL